MLEAPCSSDAFHEERHAQASALLLASPALLSAAAIVQPFDLVYYSYANDTNDTAGALVRDTFSVGTPSITIEQQGFGAMNCVSDSGGNFTTESNDGLWVCLHLVSRL